MKKNNTLIQDADRILQAGLKKSEKQKKEIQLLADTLYNAAFDLHVQKSKHYYSETLYIDKALVVARENAVLAEKARDLYQHIGRVADANETQRLLINRDLQPTIMFLEARQWEGLAETEIEKGNYAIAILHMTKAVAKYEFLSNNEYALPELLDIQDLKVMIKTWKKEQRIMTSAADILHSLQFSTNDTRPENSKKRALDPEATSSHSKMQCVSLREFDIANTLKTLGAIQNTPKSVDYYVPIVSSPYVPIK